MKHLVIAEKPSVARDIARVLGCTKKMNAYMEGTEYIVNLGTGTSGHTGRSGRIWQTVPEMGTGHIADRAERMEAGGDPPDNRSVQGCAGADL